MFQRSIRRVAPIPMRIVGPTLRGQLGGIFAHEFQKPRYLEDILSAEPNRMSAGTLDDREVTQQLHLPVVLESDIQPDRRAQDVGTQLAPPLDARLHPGPDECLGS